MTESTQRMLYLLPTWMDMVKKPESNGAKFLDVIGLEVDTARSMLNSFINDTKIGTVDVSQIDIIYKADYHEIADDLGSLVVYGIINNEEHELTRVTDIATFYSAADPDIYIGYEDDNVIYLRSNYEVLRINNTVATTVLHHVWNALDEIGLLLAIPRLYSERNAAYYARLLRALDYPRDGTIKSARANIEIELGLDKNEAQMYSMANAAFQNSLLDDEGNPSEQLLSYASRVNHYMSQTWNTAIWDKSYWVSVNDSHLGFSYIPHIWSIPEKENPALFKSGVEGENDLLVYKPSMDDEQEDIEYVVGLEGQSVITSKIYPERRFKYKLYAVGKVIDPTANPETYYYTVVAAPKISLNMQISAAKAFTQKAKVGFTATDPITPYVADMTAEANTHVYNVSMSEGIANTLQPGNKINHPSNSTAANYLKIHADFASNETANPTLSTVTLTYNDGTVNKTINITGDESTTDFTFTDNVLNIGWNTNDISGAVGAAIVLDNTEFDGSDVKLVMGSYSKTFDNASEWNQSDDHHNVDIDNYGIKLKF